MKIYSKFDYVVSRKSKHQSVLSQREESELINPVGLVLKELKLDGSECIGFEHSIDGIEQYRSLGVFSVLIGSIDDKDKKKADFNVGSPSAIPLEEIIFNYYKKSGNGNE